MDAQDIYWDEYVQKCRDAGVLAKQLFVVLSDPVAGIEAVKANRVGHLAYQKELEAKGIMFAAGPFADDKHKIWSGAGMIIIRAESLEDARKIADGDPMHSNGARAYRIRPWLMNEGSLTVKLSYSNGGTEII